MVSNRFSRFTRQINSRRINQSSEVLVTTFILFTMCVPFSSVTIYLVISGGVLVLLCIKNFSAVMVGMCIGGLPFLTLVKSTTGLSITLSIIGMIIVETIMLAFYRRPVLASGGYKKQFFKYSMWMAAIYVLILTNFVVAPKTEYNIYYVQFFLTYVTFSCLSGILVLQTKLKLRDIFLPILLLFVCVFPMFNFTIINIPAEIRNSTIGLRGYQGLDSISLGRLAGSLFVLVFCVLWENRNESKRIMLFIQGVAGFAAALPILWYSQTRQAMISAFLVVELGSLLLFLRRRELSVRQRFYALIVAVFLAWSSFAFFGWSETHLAQSRVHEGMEDPERRYEWQVAWEGILENPIIGCGFASYYSRYGIWPHNLVLESWYDYGIAGLYFFCGSFIIVLVRLQRSQTGYFFWLLLGVYWIIVLQVSGDIPRNSVLFVFVTIAFLFPLQTNRTSNCL